MSGKETNYSSLVYLLRQFVHFQAQRDENPVVDLKKADEDAKRLYAAGKS